MRLRTAVLAGLVGLCATPIFAKDEPRFTRTEHLRYWSFFNDNGFCWMATAHRFEDGIQLLMTVDMEGELAITVEGHDDLEFTPDRDPVLQLGSADVVFKSQGAWAWPKSNHRSHILDQMFESGFSTIVIHVDRDGFSKRYSGRLRTDLAQDAYQKVTQNCQAPGS